MSLQLIEQVKQFAGRRIVLLGDLMVDRYLYGNAERLCNEAPVPVLHFHSEESHLGGAGRVAAGITAKGASVRVIGLVGQDESGQKVRSLLTDCQAEPILLESNVRPTVCKVRLVGMAQHRHPQQMMRLDYEDATPIDSTIAARVIDTISKALDNADALCIEDYNKGLVTPDVCQACIRLARAKDLPVLVDPGPIADFAKYRGASVLKPNRPETTRASGLPVTDEAEYTAAAEWLLHHLDLQAAIITLDKDGMYLATRQGDRHWICNPQLEVYDVTGAGDEALATLSVARAAGADWLTATTLANITAGLECKKFGFVPITTSALDQELLRQTTHQLGKRRSLDQLLPELAAHRADGKRIVFTNGCFDLIHLGHVKYFQYAKAQGDILVVAVNTDSSIHRLKGDKRPIISEHDRISVLEELESIDYLVPFDDDTPLRLIEQIRPDALAKGADYTREQVVGHDIVESYGGKVVLVPLVDGRSTSALIQRILSAYSTSSNPSP